MEISAYSFFMAVLWGNLFILISLIISRWNRFISYSVFPLLLFLFATLMRLVISVELQFAKIIRIHDINNPLVLILNDFAEFSRSGMGANMSSIFVATWVIISGLLTIRYVRTIVKDISATRRITSERDVHAEKILIQLLKRKSLNMRYTVYRTNAAHQPFSSGILNPAIFIPEIDLTSDELKGILLHEWSHCRNHDVFVRIIIDFICIMFWWNPLTYLLRKNMFHAMELRCDQDARRILDESEIDSYLKAMLKFAKLSTKKQAMPASGADRASFISSRLEQRFIVLSKSTNHSHTSNVFVGIFYGIMIGLFAMSFMFVVQPYVGLPDYDEQFYNRMGSSTDPSTWTDVTANLDTYFTDNGEGTLILWVGGKKICEFDDVSEIAQYNFEILKENDYEKQKIN